MIKGEKELIKYIKINDSIKEIDITSFRGGETEKVFIISNSSFQYKVDIKKFVQKQYTKEQIQSIISGGIRLEFTFDEIKSLKQNQKEFFIVNGKFLSKIGISFVPESSNIFYYEINSKKFLYFMSEGRILMIEPGYDILQNINNNNNIDNKENNINIDLSNISNYNFYNNLTSNNNIFNSVNGNVENKLDNNNYTNNNNIPISYISNSNINLSTNKDIIIDNNLKKSIDINNDKKKYILNSLILIYASDKELNKINSSNLPDKYDLKNYIIINIKWLNEFKDKLHYNQINKILSQYTQFNNYNDYLNNLESIKSNNEIQNFSSNIKDIPDNLSVEIQLLPEIEYLPQNLNYNWPNNFYLIHESLFNIFRKFANNDNENYEKKYKIIFGKSNIYLQSIKNTGNIYVYIYHNKCFILLAIILFPQGIIFDLLFDKFLKTKPFIQYLKENKFDLNKVNHTQDIINRNKQKFGVLILKSSPNELILEDIQKKSSNYNINNDENIFVLYFTYEGKEVYLDLTKDILFSEVKNQLCQKYSWIPSDTINYYIMKENKMKNIDMNKTIEQNGIKNGDKICIIGSGYEKKSLQFNNKNNSKTNKKTYENLLIELNEEKNINKNLKFENNQLKKELNEENNIIMSLTISKNINIRKISELEQLINNKNKELKDLNDKIDSIISLIKSIGPNEKIYALNFISRDQNIHYCIPCKNIDLFIRLEEKLYNIYILYTFIIIYNYTHLF